MLLQSNMALRLELAATRARVAELEGAATDPVVEKRATALYIAKYLSKNEASPRGGSRGGRGGRGGRGESCRYSFPKPFPEVESSEHEVV